MTTQRNLNRLIIARDKTAMTYEDEARDEFPDNGNLSTMNEAILRLNTAIRNLEKRLKE